MVDWITPESAGWVVLASFLGLVLCFGLLFYLLFGKDGKEATSNPSLVTQEEVRDLVISNRELVIAIKELIEEFRRDKDTQRH